MSSLQPVGNNNNNNKDYRPTSIDFINRPNPVEPSNVGSHGSRAKDDRQSGRYLDEELLRVLLGPRTRDATTDSTRHLNKSSERQAPAHSLAAVLNDDTESNRAHGTSLTGPPKDLDPALYTLPEPPVKRGARRPPNRVPPVLQGLHQPPPDAGLLPSINVTEDRVQPLPSVEHPVSSGQTQPEPGNASSAATFNQDQGRTGKPTPPFKRNPWTDEETEVLIRGVERFGIGNWKQILECKDFTFNKRNAVDLKDRFRFWTRHQAKQNRAVNIVAADFSASTTRSDDTESQTVDREQASSEADGTGPRFTASTRRKRKRWTEQEDAALENAFRRYGNSWSSFLTDPVLDKRTATDIRDRFRIRFPDKYKQVGLAPKHRRLTVRPTEPSSPLHTPPSEEQRTGEHRSGEQANRILPPAPDSSWPVDHQFSSEGNDFTTDRSNWQLPSLPSILAGSSENNNNDLQGIDPRATLLPRPPPR